MQTSMSSTPSPSRSPSRSPSPAPIGRFAPSPTGPLHLGSLVAALASYLDAKSQQGTWLVRMEDVDETRCKPEFVEDILRTLTVFGLHWDGDVMLQSQRKPAYAQALARLSAQAHTYGCVCSRKEIADSAESGIEGPVYPGTCRHRRIGRTEYAGQVRNIAPAEAIRVLTHNEAIIFTDDVQGECSQRVESQIGDFIIRFNRLHRSPDSFAAIIGNGDATLFAYPRDDDNCRAEAVQTIISGERGQFGR